MNASTPLETRRLSEGRLRARPSATKEPATAKPKFGGGNIAEARGCNSPHSSRFDAQRPWSERSASVAAGLLATWLGNWNGREAPTSNNKGCISQGGGPA